MGKKGWLSAVKRAVVLSYSKDKKGKRSHRSNSKKSRHGNQMMSLDTCSVQAEVAALPNPPMAMEVDADLKQPEIRQIAQPDSMPDEPKICQITQSDSMAEEPVDLKQPNDQQIMEHDSIAQVTAMVEEPVDLRQPDDEQIMQPDSTAHDATAMEEEPAAPSAADDDDVISVASTTLFSGKSKEEIAAIKIQTAYRGYMARKDWRVLRARRRLRVMIKGLAVKRQTASTLMCMQTMARVQSQVRSRKIRMAEVNKDLQRQLLQKTKKDIARVKSSEKVAWDLSPKSKEQVEASLRKKRETAERREKALAYIHTHQQIWRNSLKSANPTSTEPWGWSWLDRWNAVRPWEPVTTTTESVGEMTKSVSSRSPSKAYSMQSIKGSPNESLRSLSITNGSKGSTKSAKAGPKISTHVPGRFVAGKKGGSSSRLGMGPVKKQISSSGSSSVSRRSSGPRRTTSKTVR